MIQNNLINRPISTAVENNYKPIHINFITKIAVLYQPKYRIVYVELRI